MTVILVHPKLCNNCTVAEAMDCLGAEYYALDKEQYQALLQLHEAAEI